MICLFIYQIMYEAHLYLVGYRFNNSTLLKEHVISYETEKEKSNQLNSIKCYFETGKYLISRF